MNITPEIQKRSEEIQNEFQHTVDKLYNPTKSTFDAKAHYQDCMNVAIFTKLAELELKTEQQEADIIKFIGIVNLLTDKVKALYEKV